MKLTYRARDRAEPVVVRRDGSEHPIGEVPPADWRPKTEADLIALEGRHRAALERITALQARRDELAPRIEKGQRMVGEYVAEAGRPYPPRDWVALLDRLEVDHAAVMADLYQASNAADALGEEYARKLEAYERLVCAEEGRPWE